MPLTSERVLALSVADALEAAHELAPFPAAERVPLAELTGRRLARPLTTRAAVPAFSNSAMDGYAVRSGDTPGRLVVAGDSSAGRLGLGRVAPGEAWRISTGAPIPAGADAVVRQESVQTDGNAIFTPLVRIGADVRRRGEDLACGAQTLEVGTIIAPHEVGVVAASGHGWAWCTRKVRVAGLVNGDELADAGGERGPSQIFDSNRHAIVAQAIAAGATVQEVVAVGDDPDAVRREVLRLLEHGDPPPDLLVCAGGLSAGPNDHVRAALSAAGAIEVVPGVRMRPGHPTWIGTRGAQVILALAGNPVAASIGWHVLGRPLLGHPYAWTETGVIAAPMTLRPGMAHLVRCRVSARGLEPTARQGSADISSMAGAQALAWIPAGVEHLPAGASVQMTRLR